MGRFFSLLAVLAFLTVPSVPLSAAGDGDKPVFENLQKRDSVLIGDQIKYGFRLTVEDGSAVSVSDMDMAEGVEVISGLSLDTLKNRKGVLDLEGSFVLTSFDSGSFVLPPFKVAVLKKDGTSDTLVFRNDTLKVTTFPIDTATFVKHDIKGQIKYPLTFKELLPWIGGALLLCVIVAGIVWIAKRTRKVHEAAGEPAHITALRKLDALRGSQYWQPSKQKMFYTGVTDAVREYINARYGISAMEMTTAEIFSALSEEIRDKKQYEDLMTLFERADFVKFAKYVASEQENAAAVPVAVKFVNDTYQHDLEAPGTGGPKDE